MTAAQEMLAEIRRVADLTARVDTRVQSVAAGMDEKLSTLVSRVERLEFAAEKIEEEVGERLTTRVTVVERAQEKHAVTINTWQGWLTWFFEWGTKVAWIVVAAYVLAKLGVDKVSIPAPF